MDGRARNDYGERRIVTILFCDVVGSTAMAEQLDPENWIEIINEAFEFLISSVHRYGGTVSQLRGDGLLALFGAPNAHEDDPDRAVLAGLAMLADTDALRRRVQSQYGFEFQLRVGINTGMVVVGNVGARGETGYTAIGDAVNVAARVEEMARPGSVEVTDATYQLLTPGFKEERIGPVAVRGKTDPVVIYRILERDEGLSQHGLDLPEDAPLFGRDEEVGQLTSAVLAVLRGATGRIAQIDGDAGLGKSRLIRELYRRWLDSGLGRPWLECRGISYDSDRPYGLFLQILSRGHGPPDRGDRAEPADMGGSLRDDDGDDVERHALAIQHLIASARTGLSAEQSAERVKREIHQATALWCRSLAADGPVALVFDDLQWADASSIDLLQEMLTLATELPILFLCASRPVRDSVSRSSTDLIPQVLTEHLLSISLKALDESEASLLVERLVERSELTPALRESIVTRTEGNPFFIEQVAKSVSEGTVGEMSERGTNGEWAASGNGVTVRIPPSVQSAVTARMDRLDRPVRDTLQTAAVIGQRVSLDILRALSDPGVDVGGNLRQLVDADILRLDGDTAESSFVFQHDLVREAAYESLLRRQRRDVHRMVAEAIQTLYPDQHEENAHRLAYHYSEAGDEANVVFYSMMAGDSSRRVHATAEAEAHYRRALQSAEAIDHELVGELRLRCGQTALLLGSIDRARDYLEAARDMARDRRNLVLEQAALYELSGLYTSADYRRAQDLATEALAVARETEDPVRIGLALNRLGNILTNRLRFDEGRELHEEALALFQEADDRWGSADSLDLIGMNRYLAGEVVRARETFRQAAELFEALDDQERLASALSSRGLYLNVIEGACTTDASPSECWIDAERGFQISQSIGWKSGQAYSLASLAGAALGDAQLDRALRLIDESLSIAREIGHQQWQLIALYTQGLIYAEMMDRPLSLRKLEQALQFAQAVASRQWEERIITWLDALGYFAGSAADTRWQLPEGESSVTRPAYRRAILSKAAATSAAGKHDDALARLDLLRGDSELVSCEESLLRGSILAAMGNRRDADDAFLTARRYGERYGPRGKLWRIAAGRASLWKEVGNDVFESEVAIAEDELDTLARTISDPDQRATFLTEAHRLMP